MSANLQVIASVTIGDAADSDTESVTTSVQTFTLPESRRGRVIRFTATGGDVYLSANDKKGVTPTDPTASAGVTITDGTYQDFVIPNGRNVYTYKALGSAATTLQLDVVSP